MNVIRIDSQSPECGWTPLLDWCESQGLDPFNIKSIELTGEGTATIEEVVRDAAGKHIVDELNGEYEVRTAPRPVLLSSPPPLNRGDQDQ